MRPTLLAPPQACLELQSEAADFLQQRVGGGAAGALSGDGGAPVTVLAVDATGDVDAIAALKESLGEVRRRQRTSARARGCRAGGGVQDVAAAVAPADVGAASGPSLRPCEGDWKEADQWNTFNWQAAGAKYVAA